MATVYVRDESKGLFFNHKYEYVVIAVAGFRNCVRHYRRLMSRKVAPAIKTRGVESRNVSGGVSQTRATTRFPFFFARVCEKAANIETSSYAIPRSTEHIRGATQKL